MTVPSPNTLPLPHYQNGEEQRGPESPGIGQLEKWQPLENRSLCLCISNSLTISMNCPSGGSTHIGGHSPLEGIVSRSTLGLMICDFRRPLRSLQILKFHDSKSCLLQEGYQDFSYPH